MNANWIGKKMLLTTNAWFYAPNGNSYRAVWGTVSGIIQDKDGLGFGVNRSHANWTIQIGRMTIAGCQVLYAIECDNPNFGEVNEHQTSATGIVYYDRPSHVYNADEQNA